jgi:protein-S-isoprenylcysteine O-methyltransferase Ste14
VAVYGCLMLLAAYLFVVFYEEPVLRRLFGAQYEEYCRVVPRWLVRVR